MGVQVEWFRNRDTKPTPQFSSFVLTNEKGHKVFTVDFHLFLVQWGYHVCKTYLVRFEVLCTLSNQYDVRMAPKSHVVSRKGACSASEMQTCWVDNFYPTSTYQTTSSSRCTGPRLHSTSYLSVQKRSRPSQKTTQKIQTYSPTLLKVYVSSHGGPPFSRLFRNG